MKRIKIVSALITLHIFAAIVYIAYFAHTNPEITYNIAITIIVVISSLCMMYITYMWIKYLLTDCYNDRR